MIWTAKQTHKLMLAALISAALSGAAARADEPAAVQEVAVSMTAHFMAGNIEDVLSAYEPDAVVVFEPGAPASGKDTLRAAFTQFAAAKPKFTFGGHQVVVAGDIAIHIAPWDMTGTLPDGQAISDNGLSVAVMRRQSDGNWKMVIDNPYGDRF